MRHTFVLLTTLLTASLMLIAGSAGASSISIGVSDSNNCATSTSNNSGGAGSCSSGDWAAAWSHSAANSANLVGVGSTSATFEIDAKVAADTGSGNRWIRADLDYNLIITIDVDYAISDWTVDLNQSVLGLYGLRGDGTASAVGTQKDGQADVSLFDITVNGSGYDFNASPSALTNNPSNNSSSSQQFSGGRVDNGVLSGTGDGVYNVSISFNLDAFSQGGCTGFVCSSISGGEEAAVLFGYAPNIFSEAVDDYSTWSRSAGPDGYNSTYTLNVTTIPEPSTALLMMLGLAGLGWSSSRR